MRATLAIVYLIALPACSSLDREYQAGYDLTSGRATAGIKLAPGTGQRSLAANISADMNWGWVNKDLPKLYRDK